jgi:Phage terminase large subunit/Terminase RNaseH-like domain
MERYVPRHKRIDPQSAKLLAGFSRALQSNSFQFTDRQLEALELLNRSQRHSLLYGGSRGGKSFVLVYRMFERAVAAPGSYHAILRLHSNAARASIALDTLPKVRSLCFPEIELSEHRLDGYFELPNESRIFVAGLDDAERVDKILGQEFATLFFNECSQIPYSSVTTALTRLAQKARGLTQQAWYDLNPVGKGHWSNVQFVELRDPVTKRPLPDADNYRHMFFSPEHNAANLDPAYIESLRSLPQRQRKRFFEGVFQDEQPGALWTDAMLEKMRVDASQVPELRRVVLAVDPSGAGSAADTSHDAIGIVVAGIGADGHAYVLADHTLHGSPAEWGAKVAWAFRHYRCDRVICETNFGGAMVEHVIKTADPSVPVKTITASRGKSLRAEPISSLAEARPADNVVCRVHHVAKELPDGRDHLADLEDELLGFTTTGYTGDQSPNRADAYVMALTELMLADGNVQGYIDWYAKQAAIARGEIKEEKVVIQPRERRVPNRLTPQPRATVKLKARPHASFYIHTSLYTPGPDGIVLVAPEHRDIAIKQHGCKELNE